jgi:molybdate/tungstate transport system substrate-binding protein
MTGVRRLGGIATVLLIAGPAIGCGSASGAGGGASHSPVGARGTLTVFGAGTLNTPFTAELQAFKKQNPGVTVHSQFGASGDMTKDIVQLGQPADVLGVADYSLIPKLMSDQAKPHATWYLGFVSNQITFAYTSHSKGANQLTTSNWYQVLSQPGVKIGRLPDAADAAARSGLLPRPDAGGVGAEELAGLERR